ncbi:cache domain-containing protein [Pontibaca salina]|uniref:Cache domain-containing protein n=1 Tax=Pontibaca salina TaxID=2795731 RepID=A0A934LZE5_9RHOB|nr:cache domain-containing protein [Pontibaca salina]MBI6630822.1 cache domain-containing protein [Pontibaca salina]
MVSVFCAAVFVAVTVTQRLTEAQQQLQQDIVLRGADAISLSFNTAMKREWRGLQAVARHVGKAPKQDLNDIMDTVVQTGGQVAWSGMVDLSGTIISGSNRLREGEDVSERHWYQEGLRGPNVGSVYSSDLLRQSGRDKGESLLDLFMPVHNADTGEVVGVMVYSLRMDWVRSMLVQARNQLHIDVVIQDRAGTYIVDTRDAPGPLPDAILTQASFGQSAAESFRALDQAEDLYAFTSSFLSDTLPDFGWRVFAVLDRDSLKNVLPSLLRSVIISVVIAAFFVLGATLLVLRILLGPLEKLTATAVVTANGAYEYPVESRSSHEAILLSRALVRIQGKLALREELHGDQTSSVITLHPSHSKTSPFDPGAGQEERAKPTSGDRLRTKRGGES